MSDVLVVFDTPGIKQFVFGTDPLKEIHGASTQLVQVNGKLHGWLQKYYAGSTENIECIYSNGGEAQFVFRDVNDPAEVSSACTQACGEANSLTSGQARLVFGHAPLESGKYRRAAKKSHWQMRMHRETAFGHSAVHTWPLVHECSTASSLPAQRQSPDEPDVFLSESSYSKQKSSGEQGRWDEWMKYIQRNCPHFQAASTKKLRCEDFNQLASYGSKPNYLAVVYADGNAMGKLVFELDSVDTCHEFSKIVDGCIRDACYQALTVVCRTEIAESGADVRLPADILLLGGDDLCVALPADRALLFAEIVCDRFTTLTRERIARLNGPTADDASRAVHAFFANRGVSELTISCGVAIAHVSYPFPLLLELAEELLKNAKKAGSEDRGGGANKSEYRSPSYVDFQVVTSSSSHALHRIRTGQYFTESDVPRTMRPLRLDKLTCFRGSIGRLAEGEGRIPRSKLHAIFEGAVQPRYELARRDVRTVFSRCSLGQRLALWKALEDVADAESATLDSFPLVRVQGSSTVPIPDFVDAIDLYNLSLAQQEQT